MEKVKAFFLEHPWAFMLLGAIAFGLAANETYESYNAAVPGGMYEIHWQPMLLGGILFIAGLIMWIDSLNKK